MATIEDQLRDIMVHVEEHETADGWALALKLGEEVGEFHETVLKAYGYLRHKEVKEDPIHEAADIVNVLFSTLVKLYPNKTVDEILVEFGLAFERKCNKYKRILEANDEISENGTQR